MKNQIHSRPKLMLFIALVTLLALASTTYANPSFPDFSPDENQTSGPVHMKNETPVYLMAGGDMKQKSIPAPENFQRAPQRSSFTVNYNPSSCPAGTEPFPAAARTSFEYGADIFSTVVGSRVPIEVDACWASLPPGVLGGSASLGFWRDFDGAPGANVWFPNSLANALAGRDLDPTSADMRIIFASSGFDWYFPTDGNAGANQYDFATVVMHEIAHGLGFAGSMVVENGQGSWGFGSGFPFSYDLFAYNGSVQRLIDTGQFGNPSAQLAQQLQSDNIFFAGIHSFNANGGSVVPLYTPNPWVQGTSYSHLDLSYQNSSDALLIGFIGRGTVIHNVGPVSRGIFHDVGWAFTLAELNAGDINSQIFLPAVVR